MAHETPFGLPRRMDNVLRWLARMRECRIKIVLADGTSLEVTKVLRADIGAVTVRAGERTCVVNGSQITMIELSDETAREIDAMGQEEE